MDRPPSPNPAPWPNSSNPEASPPPASPAQKARGELEALEPRILLSASWADGGAADAPGEAPDPGLTLTGSDQDDVLIGGLGNDVLIGGAGNDKLLGGGGADHLLGNAGDDLLDGGPGNDVLDGGAGIDTASYASAGGAVNVNLATGQATGAAGHDTLIGIENVIGSAHNDTLIGDGGANVLSGGAGNDSIFGGADNDTLLGGAGDDLLDGGSGNDVLDGGAGTDTATYASAGSAVNVNLATGQATGGAGNDTLIGIENVTGSRHNDTLVGNAAANALAGGAGNDTLDGGLGDDVLDGGAGTDTVTYAAAGGAVNVNLATGQATGAAGNDTLIGIENVTGSKYDDTLIGDGGANVLSGGAGNDCLSGGAGNDTLEGGAGNDVLDGGAGTDTATYASAGGAVHVNLATGQATGAAGNDTLIGIENVTGSKYDDTLIGDGGANVLSGGAGNDTLSGGAGNDTLDGGAGDDVLDGGAGTDTATYASAGGAVHVNLATGQATGAAGNDTLKSIENVIGSKYDDTLIGDAGANVLSGGAGDDVLDGGLGNDTLDGGSGTDTASYASAGGPVSVNLTTGKATGGAGNDTLKTIENVIGSPYDDVLVGDAGANLLSGGAGVDIISGGAGDDTLEGGAGDDVLDGGAGTDTASYASAGAAVQVNLAAGQATGGAGQDTLAGIENVIGSSFDDTLIGDDHANVLVGGAGHDVIRGGGGADVLHGGAGDDVLDGGGGFDTADYSDAPAGVRVDLTVQGPQDTLGAGVDSLTNIERVVGSAHNDVFAFSQPVAGAKYQVDGGGGNNTIALQQFSRADAVFHKQAGTVRVALPGGGSFTIEYANVQTVSFADGDVRTTDTPPVANAGPDLAVDENQLVQLSGAGSHDADGDLLTYEWVQTGGPAVQLSNPHAPNPTFVAPEGLTNTELTFELRVRDGTHTSVDTVRVLVHADDDAPSADAGPDLAVDEGAVVQLQGAGSDPEGRPLTYEWVQTGGPAVQLSNPHAPSPTFTAPATREPVTLTFELRVSDGHSVSVDTVNVAIAPVNVAPVAADDAAVTTAGTPVTIANVLANDTDADGDPLTVVGFTPAAHGTVTPHGDGTFTYTPAPGFVGQDSFTYTVVDGRGGQHAAVVTIRVDPPPAADELAPTTGEPPTTLEVGSGPPPTDPGVGSGPPPTDTGVASGPPADGGPASEVVPPPGASQSVVAGEEPPAAATEPLPFTAVEPDSGADTGADAAPVPESTVAPAGISAAQPASPTEKSEAPAARPPGPGVVPRGALRFVSDESALSAAPEASPWNGNEKMTILDPRAAMEGQVTLAAPPPGVQTGLAHDSSAADLPSSDVGVQAAPAALPTGTPEPIDLAKALPPIIAGQTFESAFRVEADLTWPTEPADVVDVAPRRGGVTPQPPADGAGRADEPAPRSTAAPALHPDDTAPPETKDSIWAVLWGLLRGEAGTRRGTGEPPASAESEATQTRRK